VCEGGVVVHNVFTLHSTGPNDGTTTRRVWVLNFGVGAQDRRTLARVVRSTRVRASIAARFRPK
jgi:hypothetical protein